MNLCIVVLGIRPLIRRYVLNLKKGGSRKNESVSQGVPAIPTIIKQNLKEKALEKPPPYIEEIRRAFKEKGNL